MFARLSATYRSALTAEQARQLAAATLFLPEVPIPRAALEAAGSALGVEDAATAVGRLLALGLFDDWRRIGDVPHAAANPLARPLAPPLGPADRPRLARAALPHLVAAWRDAAGDFPADQRGLATAEIALEASAEAATLEAAVLGGAAWLAHGRNDHRPGLALIERVLAAPPQGYEASPYFVQLGIECAALLGEVALLERLMACPVRRAPPGDAALASQHAYLDLCRAERITQTGQIVAAEDLVRRALTAMRAAGDERGAAFAAG